MAGDNSWREVPFGEIAAVRSGYAFKSTEWCSSGIPVVKIANVKSGRLDMAGCSFVDPEVAKTSGFMLSSGDILVGLTGYVGDSAIVRNEGPLVLNQRVGKISPRDGVDPRFVHCVLSSPEFRAAIERASHGSAQANVSPRAIEAIAVLLPPVAEQRAIAHILGTLDDKIELNRQMNETLEAMARALFKSWFVDFDPVHAKAAGRQPTGMDAATAAIFPSEFVESEIGLVPRGWRPSTLGIEVGRCGGAIQTGPFGSQLHASDYVPDGVPVVMPKDIIGRRVSAASIARILESDAKRLARHRVEVGDIIYSRRGDVERHALISQREVGWLCGTGCLLVRPGARWPSSAFASIALDRPETRAWIVQHAIGATMPNLNTGILSDVPLIMPPDGPISAFARLVDPLLKNVERQATESTVLATIRDAILPRLLSGSLSSGGAMQSLDTHYGSNGKTRNER